MKKKVPPSPPQMLCNFCLLGITLGGLFLAACSGTGDAQTLDLSAAAGLPAPGAQTLEAAQFLERPAPSPAKTNLRPGDPSGSAAVNTVYHFDTPLPSATARYASEDTALLPELRRDFKTPADAALLGLTAPGSGYPNGAGVIAAMDARWVAAQGSLPVFYPTNPILGPAVIDGTRVYYHAVYSDEPSVGFALNTLNGLLVYVRKISGTAERSIKFNIAVIDPKGEGWVTGSGAGDLPNFPDAYVLRARDAQTDYYRWFSAGELTGGAVRSTIGLSEYHIYIIVRSTDFFTTLGYGDLNRDDTSRTLNVIRVQ